MRGDSGFSIAIPPGFRGQHRGGGLRVLALNYLGYEFTIDDPEVLMRVHLRKLAEEAGRTT